MSDISPASRALSVHEIYPVAKTSEVREIYADEGKSEEESEKVKEAYQSNESRSREANQDQYVEESGRVTAYEMKNGNMQTSTTYSSSNSTESWVA